MVQRGVVTRTIPLGGPGSREASITVSVAEGAAVGADIVVISAGASDSAFPNTFGDLSLTKAQLDALQALVAGVVADARQGATPG